MLKKLFRAFCLFEVVTGIVGLVMNYQAISANQFKKDLSFLGLSFGKAGHDTMFFLGLQVIICLIAFFWLHSSIKKADAFATDKKAFMNSPVYATLTEKQKQRMIQQLKEKHYGKKFTGSSSMPRSSGGGDGKSNKHDYAAEYNRRHAEEEARIDPSKRYTSQYNNGGWH